MAPHRLGLVVAALFGPSLLSSCESCDFSFGPIPVTVTVLEPRDRPVTVTVCAEDQGCDTLLLGPVEVGDTAAPTGTAYTGGTYTGAVDTGPYTERTPVSWRGYWTCKHPELVVTAEAEGCETVTEIRPRARKQAAPHFRLSLRCGR